MQRNITLTAQIVITLETVKNLKDIGVREVRLSVQHYRHKIFFIRFISTKIGIIYYILIHSYYAIAMDIVQII